jgi:hypothetical protein
MRLSCQKAFLLVAALTLACHESTSPPQTVARQYRLVSVDGQPLPAVLNARQGDTTRILWATIALDVAGNAYSADHWRRVYPPNPAEEATLSLQQEYRISGDNITVGSFTPCPENAVCIGNKTGKITESTLTLSYADSPTAPVYFYGLMPVD